MADLPEEEVLAALEELLGWPAIARSPQLARFLTYIVTARLKGEESSIKAYAIAVDVFGRPQSFDPQSDPIVRVQARRLRALLDQFYDEGHPRTQVRIELPVGRYVPEFRRIGDRSGDDPNSGATPGAPPAGKHRVSRRGLWLAGLAAGVVLAIGLALFALTRPGAPGVTVPTEPRLLVGAFSNLSGDPAFDSLGAELAAAVQAALAPFEDIELRPDDPSPAAAPLPEGTYRLSGVIHPMPDGIEVTATLTGHDGEALWGDTFREPLSGDDRQAAVGAVSRGIARALGPFRGPLHARGRAWLDAQQRPLPAVGRYVCMLTYRLARESGSSTHIADALACFARLLKLQPDLAVALSAEAWLEMCADFTRLLPQAELEQELEEPLAKAERAAELAPESSLVHEHLGAIRNWQGRFDASEQEYIAALRYNPLNTDARAGYAIMLLRRLDWVLSGEQAALAIADTPYPSPWYYYPAALNAFREGRLEAALAAARTSIRFAGGEVGTAIALAAASALGRQDVVEELLPRLMGMESLRRAGVMPWLAAQLDDPGVLARIAVGLARAGVPQAALRSAF